MKRVPVPLKMFCAAALMLQVCAASAADWFEVGFNAGGWNATTSVRPGDLGLVSESSVTDLVPGQPGVPFDNSLVTNWELESGQAPGGGGSLRSSGTISTQQSMVYTLEATSPTLSTLKTSGHAETTGQWTFYDGSGTYFTDYAAFGGGIGVVRFVLDLDQPADVRLGGLVWSTGPDVDVWGGLYFNPYGAGTEQTLVTWDIAGTSEALAAQVRLPTRGSLRLDIFMSGDHRLPCCDLVYSGSQGWDLALEASALPVPEPAPAALLLTGIVALGWRRSAALRGGMAQEL